MTHITLQTHLDYAFNAILQKKSNNCKCYLYAHTNFIQCLSIYNVRLANFKGDLMIEHEITLPGTEGHSYKMSLRGIIYHTGYHVITQIIGIQGDIWYHDGMITNGVCTLEGYTTNISMQQSHKFGDKTAIMAIYAIR